MKQWGLVHFPGSVHTRVMEFSAPLIPAKLIQRYKRFLADVVMPDGETITVHCPNSGAMMGVAPPGARCWVSRSDTPKRKLAHTLENDDLNGVLVGINTHRPNALAREAIVNGVIPELGGFDAIATERTYRHGEDKSRFDLALESADGPCTFVEVKNVHLCRTAGLAEFPDSVTSRGAKHLSGLAHAIEAGHRAVQLYIVQRNDCDAFSIADDIDPAYANALARAKAIGVEVMAYACEVTPSAITVLRPLAFAVRHENNCLQSTAS